MLAYHNDPKIKAKYLRRVRAHAKADKIIKGKYWENGGGCAVGCTVHGSDHKRYETELGIPQKIAHLEDFIFERLPNKLAMTWPIRFLVAIPTGADLKNVWPKFAIFLLTDKTQCNSDHPQCEIVARAYQEEMDGIKQDWEMLTIKSAYASYAAYGAAYVTNADIDADAYVAAADAANAYAANAYAANADRQKAVIHQSEKLLELLKECEP